MSIFGVIFIIFGIILIIFPELVGILLGILFIIIGISAFIAKNAMKNGKKSGEGEFIQFGDYKIYTGKKK